MNATRMGDLPWLKAQTGAVQYNRHWPHGGSGNCSNAMEFENSVPPSQQPHFKRSVAPRC